MKLKQLSVPLENAIGRAYEVLSVLGERGINLRALNLVDSGDFGELWLLVSNLAEARQILMENRITARVSDVVAFEIEDRPNALAEVLTHLTAARIPINYAYAFAGNFSGNAVMIFSFEDNDEAIELLQRIDVPLLNAEAFGMIDTAANACSEMPRQTAA